MNYPRVFLPTILILITCFFFGSGNASAKGHRDKPADCIDTLPLPSFGETVQHDREPMVIKRVEPEYPRIAKQAGLSGTTILAVLVDRCGKVREAEVATSSGTQALDDGALYAVKQWRFRPAEDHGQPVAVWTRVPIEFKLP